MPRPSPGSDGWKGGEVFNFETEGAHRLEVPTGGVNHRRSHCCFGETLWFDDRGEIQRCDWLENLLFVCAQYEFPGYGFFQANHIAVLHPDHHTTELQYMTVTGLGFRV